MSKSTASKKPKKPQNQKPHPRPMDEAPKDNSPYCYQREKIKIDLRISEIPWTSKQKSLIDLVLNKNTKCVLLKGPAGSSKTVIAMYCGLQLLNQRRLSDIILTRVPVESSKETLGFLPGDLGDKMAPYMAPFEDKLKELLSGPQATALKQDNRIQALPVNYARGKHLPANFIFIDEAQNLDLESLQTMLTRMGEFSKMMVAGDTDQSDLCKSREGFSMAYDWFNQPQHKEAGVHCFEFLEEDIMRSEFCRYVVAEFRKMRLAMAQRRNTYGPNVHLPIFPSTLDNHMFPELPVTATTVES